MPHLTILIGLPGSGKSSLATHMAVAAPGCRIISTDRIRARFYGDEAIQGAWLKIWAEVERQMQQTVIEIQNNQANWAIYDATNAGRKKRREAIALARKCGFTDITGLWLNVPLEVCLERNRQRDRQVPEKVILHMHRQLADIPPALDEGFDAVNTWTHSMSIY